jgi:hypothetical protein
MASDLRFLCQSLLANRSNLFEYDSIIRQFITALQIDSVVLTNFVIDPAFPTFVQCLLFVLTRAPVPSQIEGKIPKIVTQVAQFLATKGYQVLGVCHIIAGNFSGDLLLTTLANGQHKKCRRMVLHPTATSLFLSC